MPVPAWARTLPPDGLWFVRQHELLTYCDVVALENGGALPESALLVTWDRENKAGKAVKSYGYYADYDKYFEMVMTRRTGTANGCELIRADKAANLYMDIEWIGVEDHKHEVVAEIKKRVEKKVNSQRNENPQTLCCTVMCSSRNTVNKQGIENDTSVFKNSYHLTYHGLRFANNHDGTMKKFVLNLGMPDKIDLTVYTKYRAMRTLGCTKLFSEVEFVVIDKDGRRLSHEEARSVWRESLVTVVPAEPCLLVEKAAEGAFTKTKSKAKSKSNSAKSTPEDIDPDGQEPDETPYDIKGLTDLPENLTKNFVDEGSIVKRGKIKWLPVAIQLQLESKDIKMDDITCLYIENPKQCAAKFIKQQKSHTHKGNNAIATIVQYKGHKSSDVYVKCLCDCKQGLKALYNYTNWTTRELPKMSTLAMAVLDTSYGIDEVEDGADRMKIKNIFNSQDINHREQWLRTPKGNLIWKRIWPYGDWCFIATPKNRLKAMMMTGHKRPAPTPSELEGEDKIIEAEAALDIESLPIGEIVHEVGKTLYFVKCPLCPPGAAPLRYVDGVLMRQGKLHKTCRAVPAHEYAVCTKT